MCKAQSRWQVIPVTDADTHSSSITTHKCRFAATRHVINFRVHIRQLAGVGAVPASNAARQRIIGSPAAGFNTGFDWQPGLFTLLSSKLCGRSPVSPMEPRRSRYTPRAICHAPSPHRFKARGIAALSAAMSKCRPPEFRLPRRRCQSAFRRFDATDPLASRFRSISLNAISEHTTIECVDLLPPNPLRCAATVLIFIKRYSRLYSRSMS